MTSDSYRQLSLDMIAAAKQQVELNGGRREDANLASVCEWQARLNRLDRECTKAMKDDDRWP